jgi:glycosyltransferase 2 family protein
MTKQRLLQITKYIWVIIVAAGAVYYLFTHYADILEYVRLVSLTKILFSVLFLITGKIILAQLSRYSLHGQPWMPSFTEMLYINSMTQLAKYLPGGIWHFVGRFGVYQVKGLSKVQSGRVMLVENLWLLFSAAFFGALTGCVFILDLLHIASTPLIVILWIGLILVAWLVTFWLIDVFAGLKRHSVLWVAWNLILLQGGAWLLIGLSFWVLLPVKADDFSLMLTAVGAFCFSWSAGYVTIFAPSGLGVREAVLSFVLGMYISPQAGLVYATLNRLIWVVVELLLGFVTELFWGSGKLLSLFKS